MATPRNKARRREAQLAFEALSIEGGLLSAEWLSKVAQLSAGHQSEADYCVHKGLNLRDEIGRYWRIAQALWTELASGRAAGDGAELSRRFVLSLLRDCFGFASIEAVEPVVIDERRYPIGHAALGGRVPVVIAPAGFGLATPDPAFGDGSRRRDAFGLAQEYLNAAGGAVWGLVCDADTLRVVRDNASLTRPAWLEADLARIFGEERFADFTALWLLAHETRFGREGQAPTACALETWRDAGRQEGTRARDKLRRGVQDALEALGQGFLAHPENGALRSALHSGTLTRPVYFQQLLRLVYRLIFLLTIEERGLLHPDGTPEPARRLYADGYGLRRLRERSARRSAHDRHEDLWAALQVVFRGLATGEARLGLPALAGIFGRARCPAIDGAKLENRALLLAMFRLSWLREEAGLARVNWRDMGPEELGSVYESLLELVPEVAQDGRTFRFATDDAVKGNARKSSGSYYTPDSLVQVLLDSALEPVIKSTLAANPGSPVEALLELTIVDPACGSGHFLLAAARRLAAHVARLQANGTPSAAEYRNALRQVIGRCIHGVDLNELAVELCKVSLWMEAIEPGKPLTFLDSHIQHGNALLGTTPELMKGGVPDDAWTAIEGDDKKTATTLRRRNKKAVEGQLDLESEWSVVTAEEARRVLQAVREIEAALDSDAQGLADKEARWKALGESAALRHQRLVADAWCAAFVWPKTPGPLAEVAPTNDVWWRLRDREGRPPDLLVRTVNEIAERYRFFHWHLAFPRVFERGGFDVVLGNPPWERVKLQEQEFFATRDDQIASAKNAAARKKLIAALPETNPELWREWCAASREAEGQSQFLRLSGRYPLCGTGDINTYAVFAEHNRATLGPHGRAGFIVPSGIATDDTTKDYFSAIVTASSLASLFDYRNHDGLFYDVGHRRFKFCLLTVTGTCVVTPRATLVFFAESAEHVHDPTRQFTLAPSDIALLNPNTRTCPTFRSRRDADINLAIYRRAGVLWREGEDEQNPWGLRFMAMFHMANDSGSFKTAADLAADGWSAQGSRHVRKSAVALPLIEAKMVHQFDHRFGDYADKPAGSQDTQLPDVPIERLADPSYQPKPRYWVEGKEVDERLNDRWSRGWLLGWRDICRSTDQRTVIASLIPRTAVNDKFLLMLPGGAPPRAIACLYANLCSFVLDYAARQKVGGTSLKYFTMRQLPVLAPSAYAVPASWTHDTTVLDFILPRVLELTYTAHDLAPFARDCGFDGPPYRWDSERRFHLRAELDATFLLLYGLSRDDAEHVLDTFLIVRKDDEKAYGEYRTKRVTLETYDAMVRATRDRTSYRSPVVGNVGAKATAT